MFVHPGVTLALGGAPRTGFGAQGDQALQDRRVRAGAARAEPSGGQAQVGAIEIQPDTVRQVLDHIFRQAGIGAGDAGLGALETGLDAAYQRLVGLAPHLWVRAQHVADRHRRLPVIVPLG